MRQKHYLILGIIVIVAIVGAIFSISNQPEVDLRKPEPQMAMSPYVEFEATVVSFSLDDFESYYEGDEIYDDTTYNGGYGSWGDNASTVSIASNESIASVSCISPPAPTCVLARNDQIFLLNT